MTTVRWGWAPALITVTLLGCEPAPISGLIRDPTTSASGARDASTPTSIDAGTRPGPRTDAGDTRPGPRPDATTARSDASFDAGTTTIPDSGPPAPADTGPAAPPPPMCGDGVCDRPQETCEQCASDCGPCSWPQDQAMEEEAMVDLVNAFRAEEQTCGGRSYPAAGPVTMQPHLRDAARLHSQDMADNGYFSHTSQDGRSPWTRIREAGYPGSGVGENIAAGNRTAEATFRQWVNSPGHCRNMMNGRANEMGIGYAVGQARYRHYWTQVFGVR